MRDGEWAFGKLGGLRRRGGRRLRPRPSNRTGSEIIQPSVHPPAMARLLHPPATDSRANNHPLLRSLPSCRRISPCYRPRHSTSCPWLLHRHRPLRPPRFSALDRTPANSSSAEEMLQQLHGRMMKAIDEEDYKSAAFTRDTINTLLEMDPMLKLKTLINKAVEEERYEDAAKYQQELEGTIQKQSPPGPRCYSDTTTQGIRVQVRSIYVNERSQPCKGQYFFAYRVRISNLSAKPVQVLSRHWRITDGNGRTEHVRGVGIVGQQPVLLPGTNFEYTSACPLGTASGKMEGDYDVKFIDETTTLTFNVRIGSFDLVMPNDGVEYSNDPC